MLEVKGLSVSYLVNDQPVRAVKEMSFTVTKGEALGIVGESGSGKSTIALAIMRLLPPAARIDAGEITFAGQALLTLPEKEMIKIRGAGISMIFQDPFTSLNPLFTVGDQIAETIELHQGLKRKEAWAKTIALLDLVKINDPAARARDYPHQFSGGMKQRVMIALALACQPELLIADEPTTALDVTIQAEILKLLKELQKSLNLSIIYITHNFGIIKAVCQKALVVYQGEVVEAGSVADLLAAPRSAYTARLLGALKVLNGRGE
ncbi:MAG: ABC transporter ATP-binding protein [Candidatus Margulisiibacteriota bacterium]